MKVNRVVAQAIVLAATTGALVSAGAQSATAVGGNCTSTRQTQDVTGPNNYRVRASCSSLQGDSKARGILDRNGTDARTAWFTARDKYYYSGWTTCIAGCSNTRVEIAHV
jgi:hypothetical protein